MARLPRLKISDGPGWYHCCARAAGRIGAFPFQDRAASRKLLQLIHFYAEIYFCQVAAYTIMGNHYHLVLFFESFRLLGQEELRDRVRLLYPRPQQTAHWQPAQWDRLNRRLFDVSELMRNIQQDYAKWHNRSYRRRGSFWGERFRSTLLTDTEAVQECLLYVELNPVRAGLVARPEQWKLSSSYLRDLGQDSWLMPLGGIFPEMATSQVYPYYRRQLVHRGALPSKPGDRVISESVIRHEESQGFQRRGVYRKRMRYFTDGLVFGAKEDIRDWITLLRRRGKYLRRRHPILRHNLATLREQRSLRLPAGA